MLKFKVGDKVKYTGEDFMGLYINSKEVYTVSSCNAGYLKLKEIICSHSYKVEDFVLAETKEEPKQMKATDKITVEITLAELAKIYALTSKANGTPSVLYAMARDMIDPKHKRQQFMEDMTHSEVFDYDTYEQTFINLLFPKEPKKSKEQIKIEELQEMIDKAARELKELREMGEKK